MKIGKRILWIGLLLTVAAALWPLRDRDVADGVASPSRAVRNRTSVANAPSAQQLGSLNLPRPAAQGEIADLFPRQSWSPPPVNAAPEQAAAPPLPFTYRGRYTEGNNIFVFLVEGARMHTARQGSTVKGTYRIDNIAPDAITLTYLPLGLQQTLVTGGTKSP